MNILITSGGTEEPIDGVRSITNFSTGATGAGLARYCSSRGSRVLLLHGYRALVPEPDDRLQLCSYRSFGDLDAAIRNSLKETGAFDSVIHLAAVSDFSPVSIELPDGNRLMPGDRGKISSDISEMTVRLVRNHKILSRIREYAAPAAVRLVGFKLTNTADESERSEAVSRILREADLDLLIHNDLGDIGDERHRSVIYDGDGAVVSRCETKQQMYAALYAALTSE